MTKIIGINGFKRSGKGETGLAIADIGYDFLKTTTLLGFADKLKILGAKALGFVDRSDAECIALMDECKEQWVFDIRKKLTPGAAPWGTNYVTWHSLTGREYLQNIGNEARGIFGEDFWVDQVLPKRYGDGTVEGRLERMYPGADYVAFTDLRYENEAKRVLDLGGEVWEVIRPNTASDGHASEQVLPRHLVTRQINNSSSLTALRFEVEKALGL